MTHRVVFLGSPEFAVPCLKSLVEDERFDVNLVVSQPDRRAGRGKKLTPPPVAAFATSTNVELFQPESLRDESSIERLERLQPDLLIVVAYGEILNRRVLSMAAHGAINVHPSLLPRYRGAAPIPAAVLHGDQETGVSIIKLVRRLDAGPVIAQMRCPVKLDDTSARLADRLAIMAARILPDVAHDWISGDLQAAPQDDDLASYTREWSKSDARIDWTQKAIEIERLVRAALPWPVAWTELDRQRIQVREVALVNGQAVEGAAPGTICLDDGRAIVATGKGGIELLTIQPESKRPVAGKDWARNLSATSGKFT